MNSKMMKRFLMCSVAVTMVFGTIVTTGANEIEGEVNAAAENDSEKEQKYQEAYEYANEKYDYAKAAELLRSIGDYKDSKELADRYEQMKTNRFIDGRFYWSPDEYVLMLKQNLKALNDRYTNIGITGALVTPEDGTSYEITIDYDEGETLVTLNGVKFDDNSNPISFGSIEVKSDNGSLLAYPILMITSTARGDSTIENAQNILEELLGLHPHGEISRDGLKYIFDYQNPMMSVLIEPEENENSEKTAQAEAENGLISVSEYVTRYNSAADYYNETAQANGYNTIRHVEEDELKNELKEGATGFKPNNGSNLGLIGNSTEYINGIMITATSSEVNADTLSGELFASIYALDSTFTSYDEAFQFSYDLLDPDATENKKHGTILYTNGSSTEAGMILVIACEDK